MFRGIYILTVGLLVAGCAHSPAIQPESAPANNASAAGGGDLAATSVSPLQAVALAGRGPAAPLPVTATTSPATEPATRQGISTGMCMTLGLVVAEANGQPIYADKVLATLQTPLAAKAGQLDARAFRAFAADLIRAKVSEQIGVELELAAAQRSLSSEDMRLAHLLTMEWRKKQISEAGGSEAVARKRARDRDEDFDDMVQQQYRDYLVRIFYERKILPRAQVSADDMRRYYDAHRQREFTQIAQARFRIVRIDVAKFGDRQLATKKAQEIYQRAIAGADFAALARDENTDAALKESGGLIGPLDKGAYVAAPVEEAVWKLQVGGITEPVEFRNAFYIARLEQRTDGSVQPFEEPAVQDRIRKTLMDAQVSQLRQAEQAKLLKTSIRRFDEKMLGAAVDMAMQQYAMWSGGR